MQGGDGNGRKGIRKPEIVTAFAGMSESLDLHLLIEKGAVVSLNRKNPSVAVVEATSRSKHKESLDESCNKNARTRTSTYNIVHWVGTEGSTQERVILSSAERFH